TDEDQDLLRRCGILGQRRQIGGEQCTQRKQADYKRTSRLMHVFHKHPAFAFALFFPLPFFASVGAACGLFGVGIGALISLRKATSRLCRSRVLSAIDLARLFFSPISSRRLYSSSRPSSRNSISFQSPTSIRLTGVVRQKPGPAPR